MEAFKYIFMFLTLYNFITGLIIHEQVGLLRNHATSPTVVSTPNSENALLKRHTVFINYLFCRDTNVNQQQCNDILIKGGVETQ